MVLITTNTYNRIIIGLFLLLFFKIQFIYAQPEDYSTWSYSKKVEINTTATGVYIAGNVANYPLLLRLDNTNFDFSQAQATGIDIRFAASDSSHFPYEIERWDNVGEKAEVWIKVNQIYGDSSTQYITMYWGNASAPDSSNSENVFATADGYVAVWHLNEDGNTTPDGYKDATSNNYDGTGYSMTTSSDVEAYIGTGQEFDGSADYLEINGSLFDSVLSATGQITISFWTKADATDYAHHIIWEGTSNANGYGGAEEYHITYGSQPGDGDYISFYGGDEDDSGASGNNVKNATSDVTNWHHVAVTFDITGASDAAELFFDGVSVDSDNTANIEGDFDPNWSLTRIGRPGSDQRYLDGILDEIRIVNYIPSDDHFTLDEGIQDTASTVITLEILLRL